MPKRQTVYKVNVREVEKTLALMMVTKDKEATEAITVFCKSFNIPLDSGQVNAQRLELEELSRLLTKPKK